VRPEAIETTKARHGIADVRALTHFQDALASDCDLIDVCTPSALHAEQVVAALDAGKHVLCEKPMADTLAQAEQIAAAARAHPDLIYLCEHRGLFNPPIIAARGIVHELGRLHWFRQRNGLASPLPEGIRRTGAFLDMGYHPLYTALHFMGPATYAFGVKQRFARPDFADDSGLYVLEHEHGTSICEGSFASIGPSSGGRPVEIYGERGTIYKDWVVPDRLFLYRGRMNARSEGPGEEIPVPEGTSMGNAVRHFLDCVDRKAEPIAGWRQALETMRTYDAALRSISSGRKEPVQR
jgi:predicted dehydrogenase